MKTTFTFFAFLLFSAGAYAQTFPYIVSAFTEDYAEFTDGAPLVEEIWDDPEFTFDLGFPMEIAGNSVTTFTQSNVGTGFTIQNPDMTMTLIDFYFSDLIDPGYEDSIQLSTITYKLEGMENNHIGKLQYSNAAFYEDESYLQRVNFQIWFYESDNSMEIHYGPHSITNPQEVHYGNNGPIIIFGIGITPEGEGPAWIIIGDPLSPEVNEVDTDLTEIPEGLNSNPAEGTVIRFAPAPLSVNENYAENFNVFPNPFTDQISIDLISQKAVKYTVFNSIGKVALAGKLESKENTLDLGKLSPGIYILQIDGQQKKIIKQ